MGLGKKHLKKANSSVLNSGLYGIIDRAKSTNVMRSSKADFLVAWNGKTQKLVRDAILEAEYRKAQAIALTRQMHLI